MLRRIHHGLAIRDDYRTAWSAIGVGLIAVFSALAYAAWIAGNGAGNQVANPAFGLFAAGAVGSFYLALAPLLHRWPYRYSRANGDAPPVSAPRPPPAAPAPAGAVVDSVSVRTDDPDFVPAYVTPDYLMKLYVGRTTIQAQVLAEQFIGKKMRVSVRVRDIALVLVGWMRISADTGGGKLLMMYFDAQHPMLGALNAGDLVTVVGPISRSDSDYVTLDPCTLEKVG